MSHSKDNLVGDGLCHNQLRCPSALCPPGLCQNQGPRTWHQVALWTEGASLMSWGRKSSASQAGLPGSSIPTGVWAMFNGKCDKVKSHVCFLAQSLGNFGGHWCHSDNETSAANPQGKPKNPVPAAPPCVRWDWIWDLPDLPSTLLLLAQPQKWVWAAPKHKPTNINLCKGLASAFLIYHKHDIDRGTEGNEKSKGNSICEKYLWSQITATHASSWV